MPSKTPPGLPTRDQILRFIETSQDAVGKREIAKHFGLHGADKIALKALLKDMTDEGLVDLAPGRAFHKHGGLPRVTVLRDFHAENIMLVEGQDGIAHYGLLDFQDALVGHPAYDLASVLEDARRDVSPAVETAMLARYSQATGRDIEHAYWALAAQRNTRILGVFVRLWKRDNKPHYKSFQPRMWGLLERDLAHPALVPVRTWFDANVPASKRAEIWLGAGM